MSHLPEFIANHSILIATFLCIISAWFIFEIYSKGKSISAHELVKLINTAPILLIDIRDAVAFEKHHIARAFNLPKDNILSAADKLLQRNKGKQVVIINETGFIPATIVQHISKKQFTVCSLKGGITQWMQDNLPVVSSIKEKNKS
jgi:rhodanese-related sulfurtransferase